MAAIKDCTDIEQSRKLADILKIESADNVIVSIGDRQGVKTITMPKETFNILRTTFADIRNAIPCWSVAALLATLPNEIITDNRFECHYQIHIRKYDGGDNTTLHQIAYGNDRGSSGSWHDMINTGEKENLIDCCVQIILTLHKFKML